MACAFADLSAVILAGGRGTRVEALRPDVPKPMIVVAGQPFLFWLTTWLAAQGLEHFVYSTGWRSEQIEAWCTQDGFPRLTRLCRRETSPLGTGGGLFNCLDLCREWILVANGDGLCMDGIQELLRLRRDASLGGGLIGVSVADTSRYGSLVTTAHGDLSAFREKVPGAGPINGGLYLFRTELIRSFQRAGSSSLERDVLPAMIAAGVKLRVVRVPSSRFIDIGTPESLAVADQFISAHFPDGRGAEP